MSESSPQNGKKVEPDERVYQTESGKMYIDTDEFVESDEGQQLIDRFLRSTEGSSHEETTSKTMESKAMDMSAEVREGEKVSELGQ